MHFAKVQAQETLFARRNGDLGVAHFGSATPCVRVNHPGLKTLLRYVFRHAPPKTGGEVLRTDILRFLRDPGIYLKRKLNIYPNLNCAIATEPNSSNKPGQKKYREDK